MDGEHADLYILRWDFFAYIYEDVFFRTGISVEFPERFVKFLSWRPSRRVLELIFCHLSSLFPASICQRYMQHGVNE